MFKWLKKLINSKISITINIVQNNPIEPEDKSLWLMPRPKILEKKPTKLPKGAFRFVSKKKVDLNGLEKEHWYTEYFNGSSWLYVDDSLSGDKDKAMDLHLKIITTGLTKPKEVETVLWENMPEDKVKIWVAISRTENK